MTQAGWLFTISRISQHVAAFGEGAGGSLALFRKMTCGWRSTLSFAERDKKKTHTRKTVGRSTQTLDWINLSISFIYQHRQVRHNEHKQVANVQICHEINKKRYLRKKNSIQGAAMSPDLRLVCDWDSSNPPERNQQCLCPYDKNNTHKKKCIRLSMQVPTDWKSSPWFQHPGMCPGQEVLFLIPSDPHMPFGLETASSRSNYCNCNSR